MGMVVQHNINAMTAYNKLNTNVTGLKKSSEKLASGYRINRAGDDAAGLAISEKMRSQIRGLNQAVRNSQDGINMIQTYEGAAQEIHNILQRMKELATESANGTYDDATDRDAIQLEFAQLNDEINQIADTDFNGRLALNGGVMADGTVISNNTSVASKPYIDYVQNGDDPGWFIYSQRLGGTLDSNGNGNLFFNGKNYEIKNGQVAEGSKDDGDYPKIDLTIKGDKVEGTIKTKNDVDLNVPKDTELHQFGINGVNFRVSFNGGLQKFEIYYEAEDGSYSTTPPDVDFAIELSVDATGHVTGYIERVYEVKEVESGGGDIYDRLGGTLAGHITIGDTKVSVPNAFEHGRRNLTFSDSITLQTGSRSKDAVDFTFEYVTSGIGDLIADMNISARGLGTSQLSLDTQEKANFAIDHIDNAINKVSMVRATFGSIQNRLEHKIDNLTTNATNLSEAESNIRDTDMANELMTYTKFNILMQASQSMLAQANQQPQSVLQLLG